MQRNNTESAAFRYDSQGRRFEKKVTVAGTITSWERYLYRDYLQVAAFDVSEALDESSSSVLEEGGGRGGGVGREVKWQVVGKGAQCEKMPGKSVLDQNKMFWATMTRVSLLL